MEFIKSLPLSEVKKVFDLVKESKELYQDTLDLLNEPKVIIKDVVKDFIKKLSKKTELDYDYLLSSFNKDINRYFLDSFSQSFIDGKMILKPNNILDCKEKEEYSFTIFLSFIKELIELCNEVPSKSKISNGVAVNFSNNVEVFLPIKNLEGNGHTYFVLKNKDDENYYTICLKEGVPYIILIQEIILTKEEVESLTKGNDYILKDDFISFVEPENVSNGEDKPTDCEK